MTKTRVLSALASAALVSAMALVTSSALAADPLDTWQTSALANGSLPNLAFGNGVFLAPGIKAGVINYDLRRSTDGVTWTAPTYAGQQSAAAFGYANGTIVMGTRDGAIYSSTDGTTWTNRFAVPAVTNPVSAANVAFGNGMWIVTTMDARYCTSTDLVTWTPRDFAVAGALQHPYGVVASPQGTLVAVYSTGIATFDGATWHPHNAPSGLSVIGVSPTGLLAAGFGGAIATSPDGITWTAQSPVDPTPTLNASIVLKGVAYGSGGWVVVGNSGTAPVVYASPDGRTFKNHTISAGTAAITSVAFGNGRYVVSGMDTTGHASAFASGVYAPPVSVANAPVLTNPKPVVLPTAPTATAGARQL